ncbi:MAG TPA: hypothetical protein VG501_12405, partial [Rhizomicrobium sp.]|nr:hypothetical protein [Rhizomicrobium sp.]
MAAGFAFDSYAFGRIDRPMTQVVFVVYIAMAGGSIAGLHQLESRSEKSSEKSGEKSHARAHAALVAATQFALGALLSGFCVFYIRSASIAASWPFLLFMAAIFIGNEYFRAYASRLVFAALLFFFSLYSYAILLVPVVTARIGPQSFLISGALAVASFFLYMRALAWLGHDRYRGAREQIALGSLAITVLLNAFYFTRVFPPLPLVLSDAGIYHIVVRASRDFRAAAEAEPPRWKALFGTFPVLHVGKGDKLYLYSAVFAPSNFSIPIVHEWQWRNPRGDWITEQRLSISISGGR